MAVDAAERRQFEDLLLEELTERDDGNGVRPLRANPCERLGRVHALGHEAFLDAALDGVLPAGTRRELAPAPRGTVRLRDKADHLQLGIAQEALQTHGRSR